MNDHELREGRGARASRILSRIVFASLLLLVAVFAIPYGTVEAWSIALFEISVFALASLWLFEGALAGGWLERAHVVLLPLGALALFAYLQTITPVAGGGVISYDPFETRLFALQLASLTLFAALLMRYATTERRVRLLAYCVVFVGLASALFGIVRQTTQRGAQGFILPYLRPNTGYAQFINKNHFAFLAEMSLGLSIGLALGARRTRRGLALVYAALAIPIWVALVLSNSRGGVLAMLCQAIFFAATFGATARSATRNDSDTQTSASFRRHGARFFVRLGLSALLLVALVVGVAWIGGDPLADRFESAHGELNAAEDTTNARVSRAEIWRATWATIKESPLAGVGFGGYWMAITRQHRASGAQVPQQAHNDYLELLASGGVIGCLIVAAFVGLTLRRARARLRAGSDFSRAAAWGALAGLCGVAAHSLVDFGLHVTANAAACLSLVVIATTRIAPAAHDADAREASGVQKTDLARPLTMSEEGFTLHVVLENQSRRV